LRLDKITYTYQMIDFDKAFLKKDASRIDDMWAITTAIGLWLNHEDISAFMSKWFRTHRRRHF
jgi:hypothetical protein